MWEESDLSELKDGQPRFALTPCGYDCLRIKSVLDNVAKREDLCFSRYEFPPTSASFDGIDFSTLNSLQLSNCANIGFVFESLLCNVSRLKLKSLTIDQPISFGASGRHKLERFLKTYVGLEEVAFSNLGQSRQCMRTISAQSATLKVLKLHEPGVNGSNKHYVPWRVADADIIATRREHLQDVENVANICRTCPRLCCLVVDQQCVNLDVIDT